MLTGVFMFDNIKVSQGTGKKRKECKNMKIKYEVVLSLCEWWTFDTQEEAEEAVKEAKKVTFHQWPPVYIRKRMVDENKKRG